MWKRRYFQYHKYQGCVFLTEAGPLCTWGASNTPRLAPLFHMRQFAWGGACAECLREFFSLAALLEEEASAFRRSYNMGLFWGWHKNIHFFQKHTQEHARTKHGGSNKLDYSILFGCIADTYSASACSSFGFSPLARCCVEELPLVNRILSPSLGRKS